MCEYEYVCVSVGQYVASVGEYLCECVGEYVYVSVGEYVCVGELHVRVPCLCRRDLCTNSVASSDTDRGTAGEGGVTHDAGTTRN